MKRWFFIPAILSMVLALSGCLYIMPVPIPITESLIEPIVFQLPGTPSPINSFAFGSQSIPTLDEIIAEAQKSSPIQIPDNFRITSVQVKARVIWESEDGQIDLKFYISRDPFTDIPLLITDPESIEDNELFDDTILPGENIFERDSGSTPAFSMIIDILNSGVSEDINWLALYDYSATHDSTMTIFVSGTVWVKRFVE